MKVVTRALLSMMILASPLLAEEKNEKITLRNYFNPEMTKSFKGILESYDKETKVVGLRDKLGNKRSINLAKLHEDCQEYILGHADYLGVADDLQIKFKKLAERKSKGDHWTTYNYSFKVKNKSDKPLEDFTFKWTIHYSEGTYAVRNRSKTPKQLNGEVTVAKLGSGSIESHETQSVQIYNHQKYRMEQRSTGGG